MSLSSDVAPRYAAPHAATSAQQETASPPQISSSHADDSVPASAAASEGQRARRFSADSTNGTTDAPILTGQAALCTCCALHQANSSRRGTVLEPGAKCASGEIEERDIEAGQTNGKHLSSLASHPSSTAAGAVGPLRRLFGPGRGILFAFYSQFLLVFLYYLCEFLEILNVMNRPTGFIAGLPAFVFLLTAINTLCFHTMRRLQMLTLLVEFICFIGLFVFDAISPGNQDDRHRTEYYDMHAHAAALNFMLVIIYGAISSERYTKWVATENKTMDALNPNQKAGQQDMKSKAVRA